MWDMSETQLLKKNLPAQFSYKSRRRLHFVQKSSSLKAGFDRYLINCLIDRVNRQCKSMNVVPRSTMNTNGKTKN